MYTGSYTIQKFYFHVSRISYYCTSFIFVYTGSYITAEDLFPCKQDPILYNSFITMYARSYTIVEVLFHVGRILYNTEVSSSCTQDPILHRSFISMYAESYTTQKFHFRVNKILYYSKNFVIMYAGLYPEPDKAFQPLSAVTLTYVLSCYVLASHCQLILFIYPF